MSTKLVSSIDEIKYKKSDDIFVDAKSIIDSVRSYAYATVNVSLIKRNWLIGKRIFEECMLGEDRAEYGASVIKKLSKKLTEEYGKGFTKSNLYSFYNFYKAYTNIFQTVSGKFNMPLLSWSHYQVLTQINDLEARNWYENEAINETWSFRTLQRNISSQYYYRLLKSQQKELVINEMEKLTKPHQNDKLEFIKNPMIAEF